MCAIAKWKNTTASRTEYSAEIKLTAKIAIICASQQASTVNRFCVLLNVPIHDTLPVVLPLVYGAQYPTVAYVRQDIDETTKFTRYTAHVARVFICSPSSCRIRQHILYAK